MSNMNISCPKCGASLTNDSLFCRFCGTPIADVTEILKEQEKLKIQKEKNEDELRTQIGLHELEERNQRYELRRMILGSICLFIAMGFIIFIVIMATR